MIARNNYQVWLSMSNMSMLNIEYELVRNAPVLCKFVAIVKIPPKLLILTC